MSERTRVLVVDDSAFARKVMREVLSREADLDVVGTARDGFDALEAIELLEPDVVCLDLVMPGLDGVGVLEHLEGKASAPRVVVVTSAEEESEIGVSALRAGAFDVVQKPTAKATDRLYELERELATTVRIAALARGTRTRTVKPPPPVALTPGARASVDVVVVGASTGGPQAISALLAALPGNFPVPIAIVVHMPPGYTAAYADRLHRDVALQVFEARDREPLVPGQVAIGRAGMHLVVSRESAAVQLQLELAPLHSVHRPSVDVLFSSAAAAFGGRSLGVVLTGMGDDGLVGARAIREAGGRVFVEAESSCVVYGMPRAVNEHSLANRELPLDEMAAAIVEAVAS